MFGFLRALVIPLVRIVILPWLVTKVVVTNTDKVRFDLIAGLAQEAAEEAVLRSPHTEADELIQDVIEEIAEGFPTTSTRVISRAVGAAVRRAINNYRENTN